MAHGKAGMTLKRKTEVDNAVRRLAQRLIGLQLPDGRWNLCFENGTVTDALTIIVLRSLEMRDDAKETLIRRLHRRILSRQEPNGAWRLYRDEEDGSVSATVEAYYALLYSGFSRPEDDAMRKAKEWIAAKGGLGKAESLLTQAVLAATGQAPWPLAVRLPVELLLLPASLPLSFYQFSGYARVHLAPILAMANQSFAVVTPDSPRLAELLELRPDESGAAGENREEQHTEWTSALEQVKAALKRLPGIPLQLHRRALKRAERYMLERIEADGTLYSYATATVLMIYGLLSLGYPKRHPVIVKAAEGLAALACQADGTLHIQNSDSNVWDTALASHALQTAGLSGRSAPVRQAGAYLLARQQSKLGDWSIRNPNEAAGGWGFSDGNTINPDVDDTTAALRAISRLGAADPKYEEAYNRGLHWVLSMQNDDGGWPAFERECDSRLLTLLPVHGAESAAIDPSTADLTGRTLEFLGDTAGIGIRHRFVQRAVQWLLRSQEADGSWYGRWGVCYLYGTWAALTGMIAVGVDPGHPAVRKAERWLESIQNEDGGWGESCSSDRVKTYVPLRASTPSQTAWALDALAAVASKPTPAIERGVDYLLQAADRSDWTAVYPTGAALPGAFYIHYHSYRHIWPLLALARCRRKFG